MDISPGPCRFCGASARLGSTPHAGEAKARLLVQCTNADCGAVIEGHADEAAIVVLARWNRRTSSGETPMTETPKCGDFYRCQGCGMELECTEDCSCADAACVCLRCCDQEMVKIDAAKGKAKGRRKGKKP
jgi:hypothetical protein